MKTVVPTRELEKQFWSRGIMRVAGIDEVGRGPLAGPVTVAAVVLPMQCELPEVRDSKALSAHRRRKIAQDIRKTASAIGIGWADSREIDSLGLTAATRLAASRALVQLGECDMVVLDGSYNYLEEQLSVHTCVRADQSCLAVAAASIIAKTARDSYMELIHELYPEFGLASHTGYATTAHLEALQKYGPTPYHRHSFQPVQERSAVRG